MRWMLIAVVLAGCGGTAQTACCAGAAEEQDNLLVYSDPNGSETRVTRCFCGNGQSWSWPSATSCEQVGSDWSKFSATACR